MAEELSQDSSGSQETSQDSGVISEEQLFNLTGENNAAQSNQNSQVLTAQNNQNNKKYDLGVLFVHGIGFQNPGDTFRAIYPSIKNEFESNENYKYKEVVLSNNSAPEIEAKITYDGQVKDVFFCESNWHSPSAMFKSETVCKILKRWASNLQAILWLIYFMCLRISHARFFGFVFSVSLVFLFLFLRNKIQEIYPNFYNTTGAGINIRFNLLVDVLILILPFIIFQFVWELVLRRWVSLQGYQPVDSRKIILGRKILHFFIYGLTIFSFIVTPKTFEIFIFCLFFIGVGCLIYAIFSSARIAELWNQITESADFVRTGDDFQYIQSLERDIEKLDRKCNKIIVIAHSMGGYLSYNSIRKSMKNFEGKEVQLISIGGGLGLVSLIGDLRLSNKENKFSGFKSAFISLGAATQAFILAVGNIFSWCGLAFDIYRANPTFIGNDSWTSLLYGKLTNPNFPFETEDWKYNIFIHITLLLFFNAIGVYIEKIGGIKMIGSSNFKFFRYSHLWDPVGNSVGFYYGRSVEQTITPNGVIGHAIRTYYTDKYSRSLGTISTKDIYMPKRTVQHIASTVYKKSLLLPKKSKPILHNLIGIISWIASSSVSIWMMEIDYKLIVVLLPLFCGFNYITLAALLWIWHVGDVFQRSPKFFNNQKILCRIGTGLFWLAICTGVNICVDGIMLLAINSILNI